MLLSCFAVQRIKSELKRTIDSDEVCVEEKLVSDHDLYYDTSILSLICVASFVMKSSMYFSKTHGRRTKEKKMYFTPLNV
jgi:hypothetical protein